MNPLRDTIEDIFAVGVQFDMARLSQDFERLYRGGKLHPVVSGVWIAARNFLLMFAITDHGTPSARPGISLARAIGENLKLFHARCLNRFSTSEGSL